MQDDLKAEILRQQCEIAALKNALGTAITWIAQSAVGCLSGFEAGQLLEMMERKQ